MTLIFLGHPNLITHVTIRISVGHFLLVVHWNQVFIFSRFWDTGP